MLTAKNNKYAHASWVLLEKSYISIRYSTCRELSGGTPVAGGVPFSWAELEGTTAGTGTLYSPIATNLERSGASARSDMRMLVEHHNSLSFPSASCQKPWLRFYWEIYTTCQQYENKPINISSCPYWQKWILSHRVSKLAQRQFPCVHLVLEYMFRSESGR